MSGLKKATFEIQADTHKALKMLSIQTSINMSELVERAIQDLLARHETVTTMGKK